MTTVLDEPPAATHVSPAQRLRTTMAGVWLSVTSLGVRKTLTPQQKAQAADTWPWSVRRITGRNRRPFLPLPVHGALSDHHRRIRQFGAVPLMHYLYGET